jgi:hypothetical protein
VWSLIGVITIACEDRECRHRDEHEGYDQGGEPSLTSLDAEDPRDESH